LAQYNFIAVEGVIGVGKSSLARILAEHLNGHLILEEVEENPFLPDFYRDRRKYAFQTQLFFLLSRYRQLSSLAQHRLFTKTVIADYHFAKDRIFAYLNLSDHELELYERVVSILNEKVSRPDFIIYLQASTDVLLERIRERGRDYELSLDRSYLEELSEAYNHYFFHYIDCPLLVVNANKIDILREGPGLENLLAVIDKPHFGIEYYNPED